MFGCASKAPQQPEAPTPRPGFPSYPPIKDANPAVRTKRKFQVPTALSTQRTEDSIAVSTDMTSLEEIEIGVGHKMITGFKHEIVVVSGGSRTAWCQGLGGAADIGTSYLHRKPDCIPQEGATYVIEATFIIFETDIPSQHMWMPEGGKYRQLWSRTVKSEEL
jgi:hypothetical protein